MNKSYKNIYRYNNITFAIWKKKKNKYNKHIAYSIPVNVCLICLAYDGIFILIYSLGYTYIIIEYK